MPQTCAPPGRLITCCPLKPIFFEALRHTTGPANIFFKACAQTVHNFRRNSFACAEPEFTSCLLPIISAKSLCTGTLRPLSQRKHQTIYSNVNYDANSGRCFEIVTSEASLLVPCELATWQNGYRAYCKRAQSASKCNKLLKTKRFSYDDVSANHRPRIRRWSHKII